MPCLGDPGACPAAGGSPEHLGELAFGERVAGFDGEPVRGHRCAIVGRGFLRPITTLRAGRIGQLPGWLTRRPPTPSGRIVVAPAVLLAASDGGWGGTRPGAASRTLAAMLRRWLVFQRPAGADEPDQEFIRAYEADCWPGRDHRSGGTVVTFRLAATLGGVKKLMAPMVAKTMRSEVAALTELKRVLESRS